MTPPHYWRVQITRGRWVGREPRGAFVEEEDVLVVVGGVAEAVAGASEIRYLVTSGPSQEILVAAWLRHFCLASLALSFPFGTFVGYYF